MVTLVGLVEVIHLAVLVVVVVLAVQGLRLTAALRLAVRVGLTILEQVLLLLMLQVDKVCRVVLTVSQVEITQVMARVVFLQVLATTLIVLLVVLVSWSSDMLFHRSN